MVDIEMVKQRVDKGFMLLAPTQRAKIDLEELQMDNGWYCVLGQIYGWFGTGCEALFPADSGFYNLAAAEEHGFYTESGFANYAEYAALQKEWIRRLEIERGTSEMEVQAFSNALG